jgi:regulator of nucleoside diphosphate kinase
LASVRTGAFLPDIIILKPDSPRGCRLFIKPPSVRWQARICLMRQFMRFAMQDATGLRPPSQLLVSDADHERLTGLARASLDRVPETAEELLSEMDRAVITAAASMPANVVRMGSTVTIRNDGGHTQRIALVYPGDADISENRISVLTPMGTALIGASIGEVVRWSSRGGRELSLIVEAVDTLAYGRERS